MNPIREKPHRLPDVHYHGRKCVAFTAVEAKRRPRFATPEIHDAVREALLSAGERHGCLVPIYTLMPDHLHVLFLGRDEHSRAKAAMDRFKWEFGIWLGQNRPDLDLQKDYYDHIVRRSQGWEGQARYLALNPVRKGLASDVFGWPYTGSIGYDLQEVLLDAWWR